MGQSGAVAETALFWWVREPLIRFVFNVSFLTLLNTLTSRQLGPILWPTSSRL